MTFLFLIVIPILLGLWAQFKVQSTYSKNLKIRSRSGITGRQAAQYMLDKFGIGDVTIRSMHGTLCDHYNPTTKELVLSEANYHGDNLAALGVAAHEAGHAVQDKVGYNMLKLRMSLVPVTQIASKFLPIVMIGGFFFHIFGLIYLGVAVYLVLTLFQLVTLPVEFDASARAKAELAGLGIVEPSEEKGVSDTLNAAAWTYVAAFIASLGNLLYLLSIVAGRRD